MATKCLLFFESDLMAAGVRAALELHTDLEIYSQIVRTEADLQEAVEIMQPDAVISDERVNIGQAVQLLQLLLRHNGLRLVLLNHEDNSLQVYQGQQFEVSQAFDLGNIVCNQCVNLEVA